MIEEFLASTGVVDEENSEAGSPVVGTGASEMGSAKRRSRVLSVLGTRPEAIKLAPIIRALEQDERFDSGVCLTAQHRELLDEPLALFGITPDDDLDLMRAVQEPLDLTARALTGLGEVIARRRPDVVLVQGDTTTAFCGAYAAFLRRVRVGHVEAGLRSGDRHQPFPEEINRRLIAPLADHHFAPTEAAAAALRAEGCEPSSVLVTGNPVVDAVLQISAMPEPEGLPELSPERRLLLLTSHRRENHGEVQRGLFRAVRRLTETFDDLEVAFPVHPHPAVRESVDAEFRGRERIHLLPPLSYRQFVALLQRARLVLTDSGGVQEEAPSLGAAVLVLRNTTERREGVDAGNALLVGTDGERVYRTAAELLRDDPRLDAMRQVRNPYGDGRAAERIVEFLAGR